MPIRPLVSYSIDRLEVLTRRRHRRRSPDAAAVRRDDIKRLYAHMVLTRQFDERMFKLQRQGRLGTFARVAGQEGAQIGAAFALRPDDWLVPAFRENGALLLRGISHGAASSVLERGRAGGRVPARAADAARSPSRWARTCCTPWASAGR